MVSERKYWIRLENTDTGTEIVEYGDNGDAPASGCVVFFDSESARQERFPKFSEFVERQTAMMGLVQTDQFSGVDKNLVHAIKALESWVVQFSITPNVNPAMVPYLAAEAAQQPGKTIQDLANEVWAKHVQNAPVEAARTHAKRGIRNGVSDAVRDQID